MCSPLHLSRYATSSYQYGEAAFANLLTKRNKQCESWKSLHAKVSIEAIKEQPVLQHHSKENQPELTHKSAGTASRIVAAKQKTAHCQPCSRQCVRSKRSQHSAGSPQVVATQATFMFLPCPRNQHLGDDDSAIAGLTAKMSSQLYQASATKRTKAFGNPGAPYWFRLWQVSSQKDVSFH